MHLFDVFLIVTHMAAPAGVGLRLSRWQKTAERYFMADGTIPGWAAGLSLLAAIITSVTLIAYVESTYAGDSSMLVPGFIIIAVLALISAIVIPFFRQVIAMCAYKCFAKRLGRTGKLVAVGSGPNKFYANKGVALLFCGGDLAYLRAGIQMAMQQECTAIAKRKS